MLAGRAGISESQCRVASGERRDILRAQREVERFQSLSLPGENTRQHPEGSFPLRLLVATLALTFVALAASSAQPDPDYAPAWPATALGLALIWRHGLRYWPAIFIANFVNAFHVGVPSWALAAGFASVELSIALVGLWLLRRFRVQPTLPSLRQLGMFSLIALAAAAPTLLVYPAVVILALGHAPVDAFLAAFYYWVSAFFSLMIFTPLLAAGQALPELSPARRLRLVLLLAVSVLIGAATVLLAYATGHPLLFLLLPLVVASSVTAGVAGASATAFILVIAMIMTEPAVDSSPLANQVRLMFAATMIVTGYLLGGAWAERGKIGRELAHRARHDALTGLMNRFEFERSLQRALKTGGGQHALLYLDLDQFKLLNDTCGHMAGDRVLRELGEAFAAALPPTARLARLGGDEFGCLITSCSEETARDIAETLSGVIRDFRYVAGDLQFSLGVSIGLTWFGGDGLDTVDSILGRADVACYAAKEDGRNGIHIYHPRDEKMLRRHGEIREASQLQAALEAGRFELHAQRIRRVAGRDDDDNFHEVLLRLAGDDGAVSPAQFLPIAHRYGLIGVIDRWVLEKVAAFLGDHGDPSLRLSVNVSGATLDAPGFTEMVAALPPRYGFEPRQLCLEVTESVAINRLTRAVSGMRELRELGFDIALDDFGSGVASFGYLRELPVSLVKLDGRFVRDIGRDPAAELVIDSLVKVAALRNIECVAEWVEDHEALERLRKLGVQYAQGHYLHRPEPLSALRTADVVAPP